MIMPAIFIFFRMQDQRCGGDLLNAGDQQTRDNTGGKGRPEEFSKHGQYPILARHGIVPRSGQ